MQLRALTAEARAALGGRAAVAIAPLPFRIGRESRLPGPSRRRTDERRVAVFAPNNDLYLLDPGRTKHVSREHLALTREDDGGWHVHDRGSMCGTQVGALTLGGDGSGGVCALEPDTVILIGTASSPYAYRFEAIPGRG